MQIINVEGRQDIALLDALFQDGLLGLRLFIGYPALAVSQPGATRHLSGEFSAGGIQPNMVLLF